MRQLDMEQLEVQLTEILHASGLGQAAEITSVRTESIGTGQVGENIRFHLDWNVDDETAPASVVGKFPSASETSRQAAAATRTYEREVGFYQDMASRVAITTPQLFHVWGDIEANDFVIVMADVTPATVGDQLKGCSPTEAATAVAAAADLHGPTWNQYDKLAQLSWTDPPSAERGRGLQDIYQSLYPGFKQRYDRLGDEVLALGSWLGTVLEQLWDQPVPPCLVHGDFRLDNMLFGQQNQSPPLTVVDWQTANLGFGPSDVAYFVGAGLLPEVRPAHEQALFDTYVDRLADHDVVVDRSALWHSYRLGSASGFIMAVIASQIVEQTERGDKMFTAMASRHAEQMIDLGMPQLFS